MRFWKIHGFITVLYMNLFLSYNICQEHDLSIKMVCQRNVNVIFTRRLQLGLLDLKWLECIEKTSKKLDLVSDSRWYYYVVFVS
jgi:hypothetical protein